MTIWHPRRAWLTKKWGPLEEEEIPFSWKPSVSGSSGESSGGVKRTSHLLWVEWLYIIFEDNSQCFLTETMKTFLSKPPLVRTHFFPHPPKGTSSSPPFRKNRGVGTRWPSALMAIFWLMVGFIMTNGVLGGNPIQIHPLRPKFANGCRIFPESSQKFDEATKNKKNMLKVCHKFC